MISSFKTSILIVLCCFTFSAAAQTPIKLSGSLSERLSETSFTLDGFFQITPDGTSVVYGGTTGDSSTLRRSLFVVNIDGTQAEKLFDNDTDGQVFNFAITSDSNFIVTSTSKGLYSISLQSKEITRLDNPGDFAEFFQISPDGSMVVFSDVVRSKIYSNAITGGERTRLDVVNYVTLDAVSYQITPDGSSVVMQLVEGEPNLNKPHLVSVPIAGGQVTELLNANVSDLGRWSISPDGEHVVYQPFFPDINLYSAPINGGAQVQLNIPIIDDQGAIFEQGVLRYLIRPDGDKVVYSFKQNASDTIQDLYTVNITGGASEKINIADGLRDKLCDTVFSLTNSKIVYCLQGDNNDEFYLYSSEYSNSANPIGLNDGNSISTSQNKRDFSEDGSSILISTIDSIGENYKHQLKNIPLDGTQPSTIYDFVSLGLGCFNPEPFFRISGQLAYCGDFEGTGNFFLYVDGLDGESRNEIFRFRNAQFVPIFFALNSSGKELVFLSTTSIGNSGTFTTDLFSISTKTDEEMCFPIQSKSKRVAVICL